MTGNACGIYLIRNKANGKAYVGSSLAAKNRLNGHKSLLRRNKHYNRKLQSEYNKYGLDAFEFAIIEDGVNPSKMLIKEEYYIDRLGSNHPESGYNTRKIVDSNLGLELSKESKERIRVAKLGDKNPFFSKHHTEESRKKMSDARKGEKAYWYGKKLPDYMVRKSAASRIGKMSGESNPSSKINYKIACDIRIQLSGGVSVKELSVKYGISDSTIYNIKLNKSWLSPNENGTVCD